MKCCVYISNIKCLNLILSSCLATNNYDGRELLLLADDKMKTSKFVTNLDKSFVKIVYFNMV